MREIKFRGWHIQAKEMFSAEEMAADELTMLPTGKFINVSGVSPKLSQILNEMIPLQFTGVKDCLGVDVYEGDILDHSEGLCKVVYVPPVSLYEVWFSDGGNISLWEASGFKKIAPAVVGNIYENPEMLKDSGKD